mmetsp:Transcript_21027/g.24018  ORF Transcript_21027/g.24018 Transcript_21027/m.24018 type:complete len:81 (-) Transcript_21027:360-602(-)
MECGFGDFWQSDQAKNCFLIGSGVFLGYCLTTGGPGIFTVIVGCVIVFSMAQVLSTEEGRNRSEKESRAEDRNSERHSYD